MKRCIFIQGGLGNQMFGYAFFLVLRQVYPDIKVSTYFFNRHNDHNGLEINRIFPIQLTESGGRTALLYWKLYHTSLRQTFIGKCCSCLLKLLACLELGICVEPTSRQKRRTLKKNYIFSRKYKMYLGYWGSEFRRFTDVEREIRSSFSFDTEKLSPQSLVLLGEIKEEPNSVSLHIRRGDYLKNPQFLDICNKAYYQKAIEIISSKIKDAHFYVFSDDIDWVKKHLSLPAASTYINWNKKENSWQDMCLMAHCRHNIIANSTFSWWGAWLNPHSDKIIICPQEYSRTQDIQIMPDEWIKI